MNQLPNPVHCGLLSPKFQGWHPGQDQAIVDGLDSEKRFIGQNAPTGSGKGLIYVTQAVISGRRTVFLTVRKGLQTQLMADFRACGLVDVRGQANYPCRELQVGGIYRGQGLGPGDGCDVGPCHSGAYCRLRSGGCDYFDALRRAQASKLVVTNYSYWIAQNRYGDGLGKFDFLVLDEADEAAGEVAAALEVEFYRTEFVFAPPTVDEPRDWAEWARNELRIVNRIVAGLEREQRESRQRRQQIHHLRRLIRKLDVVAEMTGRWVIERNPKSVKLAPLSVAPFAEKLLFHHIAKVLLISATITPKTLESLGIAAADADFFEYPSTFPVCRRPVIQIDSVRVRHDWSEADQRAWIRKIDQIVGKRLDRRGIIHTVSYERRNLVLQHSEYASIMLSNNGRNTSEIVAKFKQTPPPVVLVTPSLVSGWDLPFEDCEYAIIGKVPFPDTRSPISKARTEEDPEYGSYLAMLTLVQAAGRGMRSATDSCEVLIIDNMFIWFWKRFRKFAPGWFQAAVRHSRTVPLPLPKLSIKEQANG